MNISVNLELPVPYIGQPTEGDGYKIVASELLQGVEALASQPNVSSRNCALLAAHALECALKAFLWHKGVPRKTIKQSGEHNLEALWNMACNNGLGIPQALPDWCAILSSGHGPEYYFRYQKGQVKTTVHGGQTPALMPMAVELRKIIELVERTT